MKSGNINTGNTEKNIIVDLNVHFCLPCFPDKTFLNPRLLNCANQHDDNLVINEKIDFRRKASKLVMSLETNIPLALARLVTPNIFRCTLLYATLI